MKGKFYIVGFTKNARPNYKRVETKYTQGSAIRKAKRYINKRGWKYSMVVNAKTGDLIFQLHKEFK